MLRIDNKFLDEIKKRFFEVGHTKKNIDLVFGMDRTQLHNATFMTPVELKETLGEIREVKTISLDPSCIRD